MCQRGRDDAMDDGGNVALGGISSNLRPSDRQTRTGTPPNRSTRRFDCRLRRVDAMVQRSDRPRISRRDGMYRCKDFRQRSTKGSRDRVVHEDSRRTIRSCKDTCSATMSTSSWHRASTRAKARCLGMAFFKSLVKTSWKGILRTDRTDATRLGCQTAEPQLIRSTCGPSKGRCQATRSGTSDERFAVVTGQTLPSMPTRMANHARFAQRVLSSSGMLISRTMRQHQLKLADRQCRMSALSSRLQDAVVILVTSMYAAHSSDPTTRMAADVVCQELRGRITGAHPSDTDFRRVTKLGATIAEDGWSELENVAAGEIMQPYKE